MKLPGEKIREATLKAYAAYHLDATGHETTIYAYHCECSICGDHAHFYGENRVIRHIANYSDVETVNL